MHITYYTPTRFNAGNPATVYDRTPWSGLENEIDRLFNSTLCGFADGASSRQFPADLYEDENNTYVRAELPGFKREDISVELADGTLTITGVRPPVNDRDGEPASSRRSFQLPEEAAADKVSAAYENGILTITLPKREEAKPKKISVAVK